MADRRKKLSSNGGTPYDQDLCRVLLHCWVKGTDLSEDWVEGLKEDGLWPSDRTLHCWHKQFAERGHIQPFKQTGNNRATVLKGNDLVYLAIYRKIFPKATVAEINAFIGRMNFGNPHQRFYTGNQPD